MYSEGTLAKLRSQYHQLHRERNIYAERFGKQMSRELYAERYRAIFHNELKILPEKLL